MGSNSTTDTDVDLTFKYLNQAKEVKEETVYWADIEEGEKEGEEETKVLPWKQKCQQCGIEHDNIQYCQVCWNQRKDWLPYKRRKKEVDTTTTTTTTTDDDKCLICQTRKRAASIIHGRIAHQVSIPSTTTTTTTTII